MSVRHALAAAVVAGGAILAVAVPAAMAQASTGDFIYFNSEGVPQDLVDPANGQCTQIQATWSGPITNQTDAVAFVFERPDCTGTVQVFQPGQSAALRTSVAGAVIFGN